MPNTMFAMPPATIALATIKAIPDTRYLPSHLIHRTAPKPNSTKTVHRRLTLLVAVHLCLAAAPLVWLFVPLERRFPLLWSIESIPLGGLMLLAFWIGMGNQRLVRSLLIGFAACLYFSFFPAIVAVVKAQQSGEAIGSPLELLARLEESMGSCLIVVGPISAAFFVSRRAWQLATPVVAHEQTLTDAFRFSVLNLLVVMSLVALVLGLARASHHSTTATVQSQQWRLLASYALIFVIFVINTVCAAHSTLQMAAVRRNVVLVLLVSLFSGVALSLAFGYESIAGTHVLGGASIIVIPTLIVIASLLVVRSCGFRLIRRQRTSR